MPERMPERLPELTLVSCPTCGLPAEILWYFREDTGRGPEQRARTRCVLMHVDSIAAGADGATRDHRRTADAGSRGFGREPSVLRQLARQWWRPLAWAGIGATAALAMFLAPLVALVVLPLGLPVVGLVAARRSWQPLAIVAHPASPAPSTATSTPTAADFDRLTAELVSGEDLAGPAEAGPQAA